MNWLRTRSNRWGLDHRFIPDPDRLEQAISPERDRLIDLEVNPLIVGAEGQGAVAVDQGRGAHQVAPG